MRFYIFLLFLTSRITFTLTIQHEQVKIKYDISIDVVSGASNCGGNCPGGCDSCPCGMTKSYVDIKEWCSKYHWNQEYTEVDLADMKEKFMMFDDDGGGGLTSNELEKCKS